MSANYIERCRKQLDKHSKESLIARLINRDLNDLVGDRADYRDDEDDPRGHGKRIPYVGWYWRAVNFAESSYTIGDCGSFVGFMENNKWGYAQRDLTPAESAQVSDIVCEAYDLSRAGGQVTKIIADTNAKLDELWPLLQSFPMAVEGFWIHGPQGQVGFADDAARADGMIVALQEAAPGIRYWKIRA